MVVYNAPFLDPKAPSVVARAVELRVRPRATHNDNVGGNSAISSVHAGAKALEGNIEKWDFMMLLFALLNSAHSLTEGRGDLAATLDNKAGICRVRNEAFRHVESTQLLDQRMPPALRCVSRTDVPATAALALCLHCAAQRCRPCEAGHTPTYPRRAISPAGHRVRLSYIRICTVGATEPPQSFSGAH